MALPLEDVELSEKALYELEAMLKNKQEHQRPRPIHVRATSAFSHFWQRAISPPASPNPSKRNELTSLRRTAYLDGLRGFAALLVLFVHNFNEAHFGKWDIIGNTFGFDKTYYFVSLPGIRLLFDGGHAGVSVFFIISGYVLSAKSLSLIHRNETSKLADSVSSALFRRWFRLYIPVFGITFVWMTCWHLFGWRYQVGFAKAPESKWWDELWVWYCDSKNFSYIFQNEPKSAYSFHVWTIPFEFRGSIVVYTSVLAFARLSRAVRLWCEVVLIWYFLFIVDAWYCGCFATGLLFCDLDLLADSDQLPQAIKSLGRHKTTIWYGLLVLGLYFSGVPSSSDDVKHLRLNPGWYFLSFLKPQAFWDVRLFYRYLGAAMLVASIPHIRWLRGFFESRFCQYLGRISFALYLVHGPVLCILGVRFYAAAGRYNPEWSILFPRWVDYTTLPSMGPFGFEFNFLVPLCLITAFSCWLAEIVTTVFDEPSVKLPMWLYNKLVTWDGSKRRDEPFKWAGKS